jgi:mevalonate pyrophosphate decarboxylase
MGQSIRKIAREEDRDWTTIAKVLMKSAEKMQAYVEEQRAKLFVLTSDAVDVIRKGLKRGNLEMAYKFLIDTGVMPQQAMAGVQAAAPEQLSQDALTEKELGKVIQMAIQRAQDYDLPSDSIEMRPPKNAEPTESSP